MKENKYVIFYVEIYFKANNEVGGGKTTLGAGSYFEVLTNKPCEG